MKNGPPYRYARDLEETDADAIDNYFLDFYHSDAALSRESSRDFSVSAPKQMCFVGAVF